MSDIALTSAMRRNLLSLQSTSKLMDMTSDRLSTGRKVNSALDNPSSFFTARGLTNRAGDLSSLLDAMGQGLQTLKAAEQGIDTVTDLINQAKAVADEAYEAAAAADKGATLTINDAVHTIDVTAGTVLNAGTSVQGTIYIIDADGNTASYSVAGSATVQELADHFNNNVTGITADFNDDTGKLELTATNGESFTMSISASLGAGSASAVSIVSEQLTDVASNTQLFQGAASAGNITITTNNGSKTYEAATSATVGDLVDWLNSEVEGVTAKVGVNGLEISSTGGFTFEGLDQTTLDLNADNTVDGHQAGRTLTFGMKLEDKLSAAITAGQNLVFGGSSVSVGGITTGAELLDRLKDLGDDWDVGTDSEGYVTLTYVGSSTTPVSYSAESSTGALFLNDSSLVSNSSFNGTFNVAGSVDNDLLVTQFNDLMTQVDAAVNDAGYKGINLLNGSNLTINFNEDRTSSITIEGVTYDSAGLGFSAASGWKSTGDIQTAIDQATSAIETLRNQSAKFGREGAVIQTRQEFTEKMINTLTEGADNLTLADMNEEGANMLALQTRQQLATSSLSMASQASQAVLSLFR